MAITSKDLARQVGVSASTVSRAFSRPDKVDEATRLKIIKAAEELGYQPNRAAKWLSSGKTGSIAVLVPDLSNPFFAAVVKGISHTCNDVGLQLMFADFSDDVIKERQAVRSLFPQVDGIILCSSRLDDEEIEKLNCKKTVVLVNRQMSTVPYVHFDNAGGIKQAVLHLRALGHTRIGYCAGPLLSRSAVERLEAYQQTMEDEKLASVVLGDFPSTFAGGADAVDVALNANVTAVIAYNDVVAIGMIHRLLSYGIELPGSLSIVGFDDIPVSSLVTPSLTTVRIPQEEAGATAVNLLVRSEQNRGNSEFDEELGVRSMEVGATLLVRDSTARARI